MTHDRVYSPRVANHPTTPQRSSGQPLVLLVDDDEDSLAMYAFALLAMGFRAVSAETAEDAFSRTCELQPDVIVADITLPGTSGLELTRRVRQDGRTTATRIIVLTGHASGSMERQAYAAGCDRFLVKPCLPDVLALEIRTVLNGSAARDNRETVGSTDGER